MADLGRKQRISNNAWLEAISGIEEKVSVQEIQDISGNALEAIREATAGKKAAYAWSAGKDSIVLGSLCEAAGVHDSIHPLQQSPTPSHLWLEKRLPLRYAPVAGKTMDRERRKRLEGNLRH